MALTPEQLETVRARYNLPEGGVQTVDVLEQRKQKLQDAFTQSRMEKEVENAPGVLGAAQALGKDVFGTLVGKPATRLSQVAGTGIGLVAEGLGKGVGNEELEQYGSRVQERAREDVNVPTPFGKIRVEEQEAFGEGGARQIAGDIAKEASYLAPIPVVGSALSKVGAGKVLASAGQGALAGGIGGGLTGLGEGLLDKEKSAGDVAAQTVTGAGVGAALGGVVGAVSGGVSKVLQNRAARKVQLRNELATNPELVAKYNLTDTGQIVKDPKAAELVRQGLPERQVAVIKNAAPVDKEKFSEMVKLAEKATKDARAIDRPSDIVGDSIVERTKHLVSKLKESGVRVDKEAEKLAGQSVDPVPAVQSFMDDLDNMGVSFKDGTPVFDGSDIEGIAPAENLIKKVVTRIQNVSDDALELHRLKKFIDEQVTFGRVGEGLSGQTESVLKSFRRNIDGILDTNFGSYNKANTDYSSAIGLYDDTKSILGKSFDLDNGSVRAGAVARRVLGNSANRGDVLEYLNALEKYYKATGGRGMDDIVTQTVFADILEDVFGTQATTGIQGQLQRGIEQAGGIAQDFAQGQPLSALVKAGVRGYQASRGISEDAKIKALKALVGLQ